MEEEPEPINETDEEVAVEEPIVEKPKSKRGQTKERMHELHRIKSEKAEQKRKELEELKAKEEEIQNIKKEKVRFEYEEALKIKEAIEAKKKQKPEEVLKYQKEKEVKNIYKAVSRDILKEKYMEEAKRRVMLDLFS